VGSDNPGIRWKLPSYGDSERLHGMQEVRAKFIPGRKPGAHGGTPHRIHRCWKVGPGDPVRQARRLLTTTLNRSSRSPLGFGFGFGLVDRGDQLVLE
jgi:hypothetical protein